MTLDTSCMNDDTIVTMWLDHALLVLARGWGSHKSLPSAVHAGDVVPVNRLVSLSEIVLIGSNSGSL